MDHYVFTNIEDVGVGKVSDHVIDRDGKCKFVTCYKKSMYNEYHTYSHDQYRPGYSELSNKPAG